MSFEDKLDKLIKRHVQLEQILNDISKAGSDEFINNSKEYSQISDLMPFINKYFNLKNTIKENAELLLDKDLDTELKDLIEEELREAKKALPILSEEIKYKLLPKDDADEKNAILEIRAGTGGEEASLFSADLFRMYHLFADNKSWKVEVMSTNETPNGGYKEIVVSIKGKNVFEHLKFESGAHRVQRVPATESSGRVHTSAATVAVLPEVEDVDMKINDSDLRIDVFRASGAGGQHVNTTDSAVRITHIPTGTVVSQQDEKSQHKNKAKALKILRSRIYENQRQKINQERSENRKEQVGSGDRSERIRTYNFPQGRVTDHRINLTLYKLESIMNGALNEVIEALLANDKAQKLLESN